MLFRLCLVLVIACLNARAAMAEEPITVKHYQYQSRYAYGEQLLDLALSKLNIPYEILAPDRQRMNEARGELEVIEGDLDIQWMSTTSAREAKMIPIRIPIYRWILGLRLMLVQKDRGDEMAQIRSLHDLQHYVGGHGKHWGDLPVYEANGLKVSAHIKYEALFKLLSLGRFDYFHRGLNEVWDEQARHRNNLAIAPDVMLFYPLPVYYFVTSSRPELAKMIEKGLEIALEDGSFKAHFLA